MSAGLCFSAAADASGGAVDFVPAMLCGCRRLHLGGGQVIKRRLDEVREVIRQVPVARPLHHHQHRPFKMLLP